MGKTAIGALNYPSDFQIIDFELDILIERKLKRRLSKANKMASF